MPTTVPVSTKASGDIFSLAMWNNQLRDNINKLLYTGHRVLTVAQFAALAAPEGTKGTVAPDEVYLEVDSANGIQWHLAYESGEPTYKWRFLGGPALISLVAASEATTLGRYVALTTPGPSVTWPREGDADIWIGCGMGSGAASKAWMSYDIGATGAVDADSIFTTASGAHIGRWQRKTGIAASTTLTSKYGVLGGVSGSFQDREMRVLPVRLI